MLKMFSIIPLNIEEACSCFQLCLEQGHDSGKQYDIIGYNVYSSQHVC